MPGRFPYSGNPRALAPRGLAAALLAPMLAAGRIEIAYQKSGVAVERKADRSPVTAADREAEAILLEALSAIAPGIPVVAEEAVAAGSLPPAAETYFLVDPLDGTQDFVAGTADFTVNVALVRDGRPVFGMILAPAYGELYVALGPGQAMMANIDVTTAGAKTPEFSALPWMPLSVRPTPADGLVALMSPWRPADPVEAWLAGLPIVQRRMAGSSYKFCLIARGECDVYPQPGATSEWDTAAGQAIVEAAGGAVLTRDGQRLGYGPGHAKGSGKHRNPPFIVWGLRDQ